MEELCRLCLSRQQNTNQKFEHIFNCKKADMPFLIKKFLDIKVGRKDSLQSICCNCLSVLLNFFNFYQMCCKFDKLLNEKQTHIFNINHEIVVQSNASVHDVKQDAKGQLLGHLNTTEDYDLKHSVDENRSNCIEDIEEKHGSSQSEEMCLPSKSSDTLKTNESVQETDTYTCDICLKQFWSFFDYYDHQETHDGEEVFKCNKCEKIFNKRKLLVEHESRHKIACEVCKLEVLPKSLTAHLLLHTDIYKCSHCGVRHTSKASLEKHTKAKHTGMKGFVCHICGKQSSCHSSMNRHMAYHSTDRPYRCKFCDFSAKSSNIIQVHTSRRHLAEKSDCDICAKVFKSRLSLQQHMKRIHTSRKHRCDMCGKGFIEKYGLKRHLKKHVGQMVHECKICHNEFFAIRKLKEHMHSHRQGCVRCPKCGKEFFYKKYFNKHVIKCTADVANKI